MKIVVTAVNSFSVPYHHWPLHYQQPKYFISIRVNFTMKETLNDPTWLVKSPVHVGISLISALKGTLSGSLSVTLADKSWKSPHIEDKKYNICIRWRHIKKIVLSKCSYISDNFDLIQGVRLFLELVRKIGLITMMKYKNLEKKFEKCCKKTIIPHCESH